MDLMRPDIVSVLKSSQLSFVRELVGADPLALFRWQILKAFFKAYFIFSKLREMSKMKRGKILSPRIKCFLSICSEFQTTERTQIADTSGVCIKLR